MSRSISSRGAGAALVLVAVLPAMACASSASAPDGTGGTGGAGGSSSDGGPPRCQVRIDTVTQPVDGGFTAGPGVALRVQGVVTGTPPSSFGWSWSVTFADGSSVAVTPVSSGAPGLIEFPLAKPGSYTIDVALTGPATCEGQQTIVAPAPGGRLQSFRFHFVPPAGSVPVQDQDVQITGGTPLRQPALTLAAGTIVRFDPRDQAGAGAVPSYVRISDQAGRVISEARTPAAGGTVDLQLVSSGGPYDMLVVPSGDVAPILITGKSPADLQAMMPLALAPGVAVSGTVSDHTTGKPVMGANVALQAGTLPSTLGVTDTAGNFTVRASAGTYGLTVTRSAGTGVLETTLPAAPGLTVTDNGPDAGAPPALDVQVPQAGSAQLTLHIGAGDPASLGAGAKAVVESPAPILNLASVTFGAVTQSAAVRFRAELTPQAGSGDPTHSTVVFSGMPPAPYQATVFPASSDSNDAITVTAIDLSAATLPPPTQQIQLGAKVTLGGTLVPGTETVGVRVTALDTVGDFPIAIAGLSSSGGSFLLSVSPERTYSLRAEPAAGQLLARTLFGPVTVSAAGLKLADQPMSSALFYASTVVDDQRQGMDGALVQVFCLAVTPGCDDPETPLAETVTLSDGSFQLMLPDPGVDP